MPIRVHLADEHPAVREGLRALLEACGDIEVVGGSGDAPQAVAEAVAQRADVVLMDMSLPPQGALAAMARLHASAPSARVVLLSLHATTDHVLHALGAGARGYLLNDAAGPELAEAVRTVHSGRRYVSHVLAATLADEYLRRIAAPARQEGVDHAHGDRAPRARPVPPAADPPPEAVEAFRRRLLRNIVDADPPSLARLAILERLASHH